MGRLAATAAKQLLEGQKLTIVRCEEMNISGNLFRNRLKYMAFLNKKSATNPRVHSHIHYRAPCKIFRRVVRGMLPHKTPRGAAALKNLVAMEGIPGKWNMQKRMVVPTALTHLRIKPDMATCRLGDLAASVGWKADPIVKRLEAVRKEKSHARFEKRRAAAKEFRLAREKKLAAAPKEVQEAFKTVFRA